MVLETAATNPVHKERQAKAWKGRGTNVKAVLKTVEAKIVKIDKKMTQEQINEKQLIVAKAPIAKERAEWLDSFSAGGSSDVDAVQNEGAKNSLVDEVFADLALMCAAGTMDQVTKVLANDKENPVSMGRDAMEQIMLLNIADNYNNAVRISRKYFSCY